MGVTAYEIALVIIFIVIAIILALAAFYVSRVLKLDIPTTSESNVLFWSLLVILVIVIIFFIFSIVELFRSPQTLFGYIPVPVATAIANPSGFAPAAVPMAELGSDTPAAGTSVTTSTPYVTGNTSGVGTGNSSVSAANAFAVGSNLPVQSQVTTVTTPALTMTVPTQEGSSGASGQSVQLTVPLVSRVR